MTNRDELLEAAEHLADAAEAWGLDEFQPDRENYVSDEDFNYALSDWLDEQKGACNGLALAVRQFRRAQERELTAQANAMVSRHGTAA